MTTQKEPIFTEEDVVSCYTDSQAVEDGILLAINPQDRVTRAVWEFLVHKAPKGARPPANWPVEMMAWFRCEAIKREDALKLIAEHGKDAAQKEFERIIADRKALALSKGIIGRDGKEARRVYEVNIGGGIYKLFAITSGDHLDTLAVTDPRDTNPHRVLWLLPNENGGMTLMFPEDY
jgi:hypothetical protein